MKLLLTLAATAALIAAPVMAKNKDVKVPSSPAAAAKNAQCRDAKGKFAKCSSPSSVPANPAAVIAGNPAAVTTDKNGKCHVAAGPKKGQFTVCPKK